jgi:CelD/BcsL family acetyltransferase involved in cellulose biosynthesis
MAGSAGLRASWPLLCGYADCRLRAPPLPAIASTRCRQGDVLDGFALETGFDRADLAARWQAARPVSPFLTWSWISAWLVATGADPVLLRAAGAEGEALGLFCRARAAGSQRVFALTQCGDAARDAPFVEHNGLAGGASDPAALQRLAAFLATARAEGPLAGWDELRLSAVPRSWAPAFAQAGFEVEIRATYPVYGVDLDALRGSGVASVRDTLGAGARARIRRAVQLYGGGSALRIERAVGRSARADALRRLVTLHQARWNAAGRPGAFASPVFYGLVEQLVDRGVPAGEVELLRVDAGARVVGVMLNLIADGHVASYVTGFAREADNRLKPGLLCHALAIDLHLREGRAVYDLLAGAARYKRELARPCGDLQWLSVFPARRCPRVVGRLGALARRLAARLRPGLTARVRHRGFA